MRSQKRRHEPEYVFDDWASVHGRLLPWSEDQTTAHYESAHLRYLQRQPSSNEPSFWQLDETLELLEDEDDHDDPFARARGRSEAWLWSTAAGSGLIAAVLFGRVLLYTGSGAHAATPPVAPESAPTQRAAPPPTAAMAPPSVDSTAAPTGGAQSASEVSPTALHARQLQHHGASHTHSAAEHVEHEHGSDSDPPPSAASGTLRINSRPWSQVFVDDRLIGNTPQLDISLPAGSHKVRLTNPEFGMSKVITLHVRADETVTRVETLEE